MVFEELVLPEAPKGHFWRITRGPGRVIRVDLHLMRERRFLRPISIAHAALPIDHEAIVTAAEGMLDRYSRHIQADALVGDYGRKKKIKW